MNVNTRKATALIIVLLASTLLLASFAVNTTKAQTETQAGVILLEAVGGTTNPAPGNYTYDQGTFIVFSAVPDDGFAFQYWIVSGTYTPGHTAAGQPGTFVDPDTGEVVQLPNPRAPSVIDALTFTANPANITCGYGFTYSYQPVFAPVSGPTPTPTPQPQTSPATSDKQVINILPAIGGSTNPVPGTYSQASGTTITMTAVPDSGFAFHYWIASGSYTPGHLAQPQYIPDVTDQYPIVPGSIFYPTVDSLVFSINPVTITCGYGYTYNYQAIFVPLNSTPPVIPTSTPQATAQVPPTPGPTTPAPVTTTPPASVTPTPVVTPTPEPTSSMDWTWVIVAVVVVIVIVIIAVVALMMRRKK